MPAQHISNCKSLKTSSKRHEAKKNGEILLKSTMCTNLYEKLTRESQMHS